MSTFHKISRRTSLKMVGFVLAMAVIFVADTATDYAVAAAVFYTSVIFAATRVFSRRAVIVIACTSLALIVVSFLLTRSGAYEVGLINTILSITAVGITTYLGLKLVSAETAAHDARERLLRLARVTTLGQLTASIAHEVSQPLAAISASASACGRWLAQEPANIDKARGALDRIAADTERASEILSRVRSLAKGEAPTKTSFDFNTAVLEIISLSSGEIDRNNVHLSLFLDDNLPPALADKVQIQQVVGNLILNAIEAMQEVSRTRTLEISSEISSSGIVFSVSDTGIGISAAARNYLFDAFWTTKNGGFGLGLTICRSIIEANNGQIWTQENSLGGATFLFQLPVVKGAHQ